MDQAALVEAIRTDDTKCNAAKGYKCIWHELSIATLDDGTEIVLQDCKLVVPNLARKEILRVLHIPHAGVAKTLATAQDHFMWPGMGADIKNTVSKGQACQELRDQQGREPMISDVASSAMEKTAVDLFALEGSTYLVMVDRYSGYPWVKRLTGTTTKSVTDQLDTWFSDHGYPKTIRSDGGPQF